MPDTISVANGQPGAARRRAWSRRSLAIAVIAGSIGAILWIDDDLLIMLNMIQSEQLVHRVCGILEFFFMVPGGALLGWIIAERFRLSKERLAQVEAHARRERLVALGRVAASLAHEVRNPLHNLRLILEEMGHAAGPEERARLKERADANAARIDRAVELVYRLARPQAASAAEEACDLGTVVGEAVAAESGRIPGARIACGPVPDARIGCAGDDVRMALDNLLRNATAADPAGIELSVAVDPAGCDIIVRNRGELPAWVGSEDDGSAVSAKPGGLGLGLSISRQIITEAGGSLQLRQVGSRVEARLRLPLAMAEARP